MGLINKVVPSGELRAVSMALAGKIMAKSSLTVATGKRALPAKRNGFGGGYNYASTIMVENMLPVMLKKASRPLSINGRPSGVMSN